MKLSTYDPSQIQDNRQHIWNFTIIQCHKLFLAGYTYHFIFTKQQLYVLYKKIIVYVYQPVIAPKK